MSIRAMTHIWENSNQKGTALLILLAIADFANDDGNAWPSIDRLAKKARCSRRTVQDAIRDMQEAGELVINENQGRNGTHLYRIAGIGGAESSPPTSGGAKSARGVQNSDAKLHPNRKEPSKEQPFQRNGASPATDAPFYALAELVFGIKADEIPKDARQHVGRALKALREVSPDLGKHDIRRFVKWWNGNKDGAHIPLDPAKMQMHFMAFKSNPKMANDRPETSDEWRERTFGSG